MNILTALKKGNILANASVWKNLQSFLNILSLWIPILNIIYPPFSSIFNQELLNKVILALAATNAYFTVATSEKIGV